MLVESTKNVLVKMMGNVFQLSSDLQPFFDGVRFNAWNRIVLQPWTAANAIVLMVQAADGENWIRDLVVALVAKFPAKIEFTTILAVIDRPAVSTTNSDPFQEVLLDAGRPFVNRKTLRRQLLDLTSNFGSSVLRIDGEPKTGKTYSYYFISHIARGKGNVVNKFDMDGLPEPDSLAEAILDRIGASRPLPLIGAESAQKWAEKLASIVASAVSEKQTPRLLIFDEFKDAPLPAGTASLIIRLAKYADEELRGFLRVVLVRFGDRLSTEVEDAALRDEALPFTSTDILAALMQISAARGWSVTENAVQSRINEHLQIQRVNEHGQMEQLALKDHFTFMRELVRELERHTTP